MIIWRTRLCGRPVRARFWQRLLDCRRKISPKRTLRNVAVWDECRHIHGTTPGEDAEMPINGDKRRTLIQHARLRCTKPQVTRTDLPDILCNRTALRESI